ncbi:hypothetical protein, partial [Paraburkholderia sp. BCC1884]|uniref:hypothetical protein n=1 Tax=Paraburkholderia sp. BCC1884 TaxID=2562668 RepID=UPI001C900370
DIAKNTGDITNLNTTVTNLSGEMGDAVKYDASAHDVVTLGGAEGTTLKNVKTGELSADSMDAVNGSQLFATNSKVDQNTSDIAKNTGDISNVDARVTNV